MPKTKKNIKYFRSGTKKNNKRLTINSIKKMTKDEKTKPFYIKENQCVRLKHQNVPLLKSGRDLAKQTKLDKIIYFYNYVFNIREGVVEIKGKSKVEKGHIYPNKIYCEIFKQNDISTPMEFKRKYDKFYEDIQKYNYRFNFLLDTLNELYEKIEIVLIKTNYFSFDYVQDELKKKNLIYYTNHNELDDFFLEREDELSHDISNLSLLFEKIQLTKHQVQNLDHIFDNPNSGVAKTKLILLFHTINNTINKFNIQKSKFNEDYDYFNNNWFTGINTAGPSYEDDIDYFANQLKFISENNLSESEVENIVSNEIKYYEELEEVVDY